MIILSPSQIVWSPILVSEGLSAKLMPEFAKACAEYALDDDTRRKLTQTAWEYMGRKGPFAPSNFFHFGGTLLLRDIYLRPGDGVHLSIDADTLTGKVRPVSYDCHNAELLTSGERVDILRAFGEWVSMAQALLDWK